jgi:hypothetical protein
MSHPTELMTTVVQHTTLAQGLVHDLVRAAGAHEVLRPTECADTLNALEWHLRGAHAAANALRSLAAGNPPPRKGD